MDRFCSRCGTRVADDAAQDCPNCHAPLGVTTDAPAPAAAAPAAGCTVCGRPVPAEQLIAYRDQRVCPECKPAFFQKLREGVPGAQPFVPQEAPIPFEAEPGIGSFFATVKLFMTAPMKTMRGQKTGEGLFAALSFYLIIRIPVVIISQLANWAAHDLIARFIPGGNQQPNLPGAAGEWFNMMQHPTLPMALLFAVAGIILGLIFLFINAGIIHAFLRLLGGGSQGYGVTLKAHCYCIAPLVLALVPFCLNAIGGIWALVLLFMLVGSAHRESAGKGALAVLFDLLLCCASICVMYFFVIAAVVGTVGALPR